MTEQPDAHTDITADTSPSGVPGDVVSDPKLDDPTDNDNPDEGTSSDWTSEGGGMHQGPATNAGAAEE